MRATHPTNPIFPHPLFASAQTYGLPEIRIMGDIENSKYTSLALTSFHSRKIGCEQNNILGTSICQIGIFNNISS